MTAGYSETYRRSIEQPEEFWAEAAAAIDWERRWDRVLDDSRPPFYRWFAGARQTRRAALEGRRLTPARDGASHSEAG